MYIYMYNIVIHAEFKAKPKKKKHVNSRRWMFELCKRKWDKTNILGASSGVLFSLHRVVPLYAKFPAKTEPLIC
jgi:hypothetical protein